MEIQAVVVIDIEKGLPEKKRPMGSALFDDYANGWNDCLDAIKKQIQCTIQMTAISTSNGH